MTFFKYEPVKVIQNDLVTSVKKGDRKACRELYESSIGYVYTVVQRYVENSSDWKDVIQEIYARVFLYIDSFDPKKGDFKFWLRRMTINQCFKHHRRGKSPKFHLPIESVEEPSTNRVEQELTELSKEDIEIFLNKMPEGYREIFMLVAIDEYTHKEVGELLEITPETSRSQYSRAKNWLRKNVFDNKKKVLTGE